MKSPGLQCSKPGTLTTTVKQQHTIATRLTLFILSMAIFLIIQGPGVRAAGLSASSIIPTRFASMADPQTLYVQPGNAGQLLFKSTTTSPPSNLHPWQDEYCNAAWLDLDSPDYAVRITTDFDEGSTQAAWARLDSWMQSVAFTGAVPFWVIDDDCITRYNTEPMLADQLTSQSRHYARFGIPQPTLVIKPSSWTPGCKRLVDQLNSNGFTGMIGAHITIQNQDTLPARGWDFIIHDTGLIPESYRGQAASKWVQSRYGAIPVILAPTQFDFQRDIVWIGSGAAGIWYPPLPTDPKTNAVAAIHLRAATTFLNRFPATWLPLSVRPTDPSFSFTFEAAGQAWAAVIPSTASPVTIPVPAGLAGKLVGGTWYNPATDQTIIQPLTRLPSVISVQLPDENLWIYTLSAALSQSESSNTIAPIQDWPQ